MARMEMSMMAANFRKYSYRLNSILTASDGSASDSTPGELLSLLFAHYEREVDISSPAENALHRISAIKTEGDIETEAQIWESNSQRNCLLIRAIDECYGAKIESFKDLVHNLNRERQRASAVVCRALADIPVGSQLPPSGSLKYRITKAVSDAQTAHEICVLYARNVLQYKRKFPTGPSPSVLHICHENYLEPHHRGYNCAAEDYDNSEVGTEEDEEPEEDEEDEEGSELEEDEEGSELEEDEEDSEPEEDEEDLLQPRGHYVVRAILKFRSQAPGNEGPSTSKGFPMAITFSETTSEALGEEPSFPLPCPGKNCSTTITDMDHAISHWIIHPLGQFRCPKCKNRSIKYPEAVKRHCASVHRLSEANPVILEQIELGYQRLTKLWREAVGLSVTEDYETIRWDSGN